MPVRSCLLRVQFVSVLAVVGILVFPRESGAQARPISAAPDFASETDRYILGALERFPMVPGLSIAVVRENEVVYLRGFGLADVEEETEATPETSYYIASSTKSFTALAAALLAAEGRFDLDRTLRSYLPGIAFDPQVQADSITIRDLLTHTAGIENDAIIFRTAMSGEHSPEDLLLALDSTGPMTRAPRGMFRYTNLGYNITSIILDRETGMHWQDLLADLIFEPAGMTRTTAYVSLSMRQGWPRAQPYGGLDDQRLYLEKQDNTMHAAGGLYSTASDLARWVILQLNEGRIDGVQVFPAALIRETHEPFAETDDRFGPFDRRGGYGLGWYIGGYDGEVLVHHFGAFPGFRSHVSFMPEPEIGVVVLVNQVPIGSRLADALAVFAYEWWLDRPGRDERAVEALNALALEAESFRERVQADLARRAGREWTLSEPLEAYVGTYRSALYGTLTISIEEGVLAASIGNLHAKSTPFTRPNSIRVELVPMRGNVVAFTVEGNRVVQARSEDAVFERVE